MSMIGNSDKDLIDEQAAEIERLRAALDEIKRRCADNGETPADRGGRWAAEVASRALEQ